MKLYNFNLSFKTRFELFKSLRLLNLNADEIRSVFYSNTLRKLRGD